MPGVSASSDWQLKLGKTIIGLNIQTNADGFHTALFNLFIVGNLVQQRPLHSSHTAWMRLAGRLAYHELRGNLVLEYTDCSECNLTHMLSPAPHRQMRVTIVYESSDSPLSACWDYFSESDQGWLRVVAWILQLLLNGASMFANWWLVSTS